MLTHTLLALPLLLVQNPVAPDAVDELAQALVTEGGVMGLVVSTIEGEATRTRGFGRVAAGTAEPPTAETLYEIGSITKTFTGLLLGLALEAELVTLDDEVQRYLPEDVVLPTFEGEPILVRHLVTHTSGLPRLPPDFRPRDLANPYADFGLTELYESLGKLKLERRPGSGYAYSNLGMGLLGHVLERIFDQSYEQLVRTKIAVPLGMHDTGIALSGEAAQRLASPYRPRGAPAKNWDIPGLAGAGALRSTAADMLRYARANLHPDSTPFAAALRRAHTLTYPFPGSGGQAGVALAWHVNADGVVWHNGQTGGYQSMLMLDPRRDLAVLILTNTSGSAVDTLGQRILTSLAGE